MGGDENGPDLPAPDYFVVSDKYGNDIDVDSDGNELDPDGPLGNRLYDTDRDSEISLTGSTNSSNISEGPIKPGPPTDGNNNTGKNNTGNGTSNDRKNDKTGSDRNSDDSTESHRKKRRRHKRHKGKRRKSHNDQSDSSSEEEEQSSSNDQCTSRSSALSMLYKLTRSAASHREHKRRHKHRNNIAIKGLWSGQMLALYTSQNGVPVSQAFPFFTWRIKPAKDQGSFRGSFRYPTMPGTQKGKITGDMLDGAQFTLQNKDDSSTITFMGSLYTSPATGETFVSGNWTRYWRGQDLNPGLNNGSFTGKLGGPQPPSDYREPGSIVAR